MLVGLYFIIPIFHAWLERATRKDIKLFLSLWGISLFLPYIKMAAPALGYIGNRGNMDILGVCDWNAFGSFYYVSGFIGYLILAHYCLLYTSPEKTCFHLKKDAQSMSYYSNALFYRVYILP